VKNSEKVAVVQYLHLECYGQLASTTE